MNVHTDTMVTATPTLADVRAAVETKAGLTDTRRRDLLSSISRTAQLLNRSPADVPADMRHLRERLKRIHPAQAGLSAKRLANIRSDLKAALTLLPKAPNPHRHVPLSAEWMALRAQLRVKWEKVQLARLARYCSAEGIPPEAVSDDVIANFGAHLDRTDLAKDPEKVVKITIQTWNGVVARYGLNLPLLTRPRSRAFATRRLCDYTSSLASDLEAYLERLTAVTAFDEDGPRKPLRPHSLRNIRANVRQFAHHAVEAGVPSEHITGLTVLVERDVFRAAMQHLLDQNGGKPSPTTSNVAACLVAIAKYWVKVSPEDLQWLQNAKSKLTVDYVGLTAKNKARLAQFEDPRNVDRLLGLPAHLLKRAQASDRTSSRVALSVMYAVAIELLLACPIRAANLAALNLERHFRWYGHGQKQRLAVVIPGSEVKNSEPIEIDLPRESMRLLKAYIADWRPLVSDASGDWLFPARGGGQRQSKHLAHDMAKVIHRHSGLEMNAHLFRHLAGMLYLAQFPGEYETVRRLLGHRKLDTTTNFYASLDSKAAVRRYDEAVLARRRGRG